MPVRTVAVVLLFLSLSAFAQEPGKDKKVEQLPVPKVIPGPKDEVLPAPRVVIPHNLLLPAELPPQTGTREVWHYYGVDSTGRFRPRVVYSPHGAYYAINGQPYPWSTNRPTLYMPYVVD